MLIGRTGRRTMRPERLAEHRLPMAGRNSKPSRRLKIVRDACCSTGKVAEMLRATAELACKHNIEATTQARHGDHARRCRAVDILLGGVALAIRRRKVQA